ncbi:hypothetical protein MBRA1_003935 [Malassezia brasiliensis]|uniref:Uncharacterized protein n=1 Tax=Malassezia brasiliensis TaxID=1821822 RepID=A0AAF0DXD0_9BASI|nr:hypothetical protein MBRA1_003935 [Malassezia brasiliensis]
MSGPVVVLDARIPVYAVGFADAAHLFYVGGGGAGRSGVTNNIKAAHVELRPSPALRAAGDLPLSAHEDAPMCVAVHPLDAALVCGVNEAADQLAQHNHHLRTYTFDTARPSARADGAAEVALAPARAVPSLGIRDAEHYQRTAAFSPDGTLLAVASSDGRVQLHRYPSLAPVWTQPYAVPGGAEVYDTDFSHDGTQLVVATGAQLLVLSTAPQTTDADDTAAPRVLQTIARMSFGTLRGTFRAARFGRGTGDAGTRSRLFALVNTQAQDAKTRASYVVAWDADTWKLQRARRVARRPGTVLSVSPNGRLLAAGTSDLCVSVLQARTLRPLLRAEHAHDFPPTCLTFSPNSRAIVSASADATVRMQVLPEGLVPKLSISDELLFVVFLVLAVLMGPTHS